MGKSHTDETKAKISAGVKRRMAERKTENVAGRRRGAELSEYFALGHPDGLAPSTVRNFGSLGRVEGTAPEIHPYPSPAPHEEKVLAAETTAEALGLRRAADPRGSRRGEPGGQTKPPSFGAGTITNVPSLPDGSEPRGRR